MSRSITFSILVSIILLSTSSCSGPIKHALVDNPSDEAIEIYLHGSHYLIPPKEQIEVLVEHSKISLKVGDEAEQFIKLNANSSYLINPLKEVYYVQDMKYFMDDRERIKYYEKHGLPTSMVQHYEVPGSYKELSNDILIEKNWTIGLDKGRQQSLKIKGKYVDKRYAVVRKLHRKSDLLDEFRNEILKQLSKGND